MVFGLNSSYSFFPLVFSKYTGGTHINKPICLFVFANLSFVTEAQSREVRRMDYFSFSTMGRSYFSFSTMGREAFQETNVSSCEITEV